MKPQTILILAIAFLALVSVACSFSGFSTVRGSGNVTTQARTVSGFSGVHLATLGDVQITLGDKEELRIEAEDNLLPYLETNVTGGQLEIHNRDGVWLRPTRPVKFYVTAKSLDSLAISGSGNITAPDFTADHVRLRISGSGNLALGSVQASDIEARLTGSGNLRAAALTAKSQRLDLSGSGDARLTQWQADTVQVHITGSGKVEAESGAIREQRITLSGAGDYRAADVSSVTTDARITGSGSMLVRASERLSAHISGSGSVSYAGHPKVETSITGSGRVRPLS
jgi:hypothetical protein